MNNARFLRSASQYTAFEGEGDDKGGDDKGGDDKGGDDKTFSQEQVNTILAEEKRKMQERQRVVVSELEALKKNSALTSKEKDGLEKRLEELKTQHMTAEERARRAEEMAEKKRSGEVETLSGERDVWRTRHSKLVVDTAIINAAVTHKALHPDQIIAMVQPKTRLVETLDNDGKPTGDHEPRVALPDTNKEGANIVLDLTVDEAVKRMKEMPKYGNLFDGGKSGGLGSGGSQSKSQMIDIAKIARNDPAAYRKIRKEKPELLRDV